MKTLSGRLASLPLQVAILAALATLATGILCAFGDLNAMVGTGPLTEDAFYYFTIACRFIRGEGLTLDGVTPTNGFHPLHLLLILPGARQLGGAGLLRYALMLGAVVQAVTVLGLYRFCSLIGGPWAGAVGAVLWSIGLSSSLLHLNGMETGLALAFWLWSGIAYLETARGSGAPRSFAGVGLLLGVGYLARVDMALLLASCGLDAAFRFRRAAAKRLAALAVGFLVAVAPWWVVSLSYHGSVVPDSGPAVRLLTEELGADILQTDFSWPKRQGTWSERPLLWGSRNLLFSGVAAVLWSPPLAPLQGGSLAAVKRPWSDRRGAVWLMRHPFFLSAALAALCLMMASPFMQCQAGFLIAAAAFQWIVYAYLPSPPWGHIRYMAPLSLLLTAACAVWLARFAQGGRLQGAFCTVMIVAWMLFSGRQLVAFYPRPAEPTSFQAAALKAREAFAEGTVLAAFQAGTVSYFSGHRVVNLDGVVNRGAYQALRQRRMGEFLRAEGVEYVLDWASLLDRLLYPRLGAESPVILVVVEQGFLRTLAVLPADRNHLSLGTWK